MQRARLRVCACASSAQSLAARCRESPGTCPRRCCGRRAPRACAASLQISRIPPARAANSAGEPDHNQAPGLVHAKTAAQDIGLAVHVAVRFAGARGGESARRACATCARGRGAPPSAPENRGLMRAWRALRVTRGGWRTGVGSVRTQPSRKKSGRIRDRSALVTVAEPPRFFHSAWQ